MLLQNGIDHLHHETVASNIKYQPFRPATGWTYGNGLVRGCNYDLDGRRTGLSVRNGSTVMQSLTLGYDPGTWLRRSPIQ